MFPPNFEPSQNDLIPITGSDLVSTKLTGTGNTGSSSYTVPANKRFILTGITVRDFNAYVSPAVARLKIDAATFLRAKHNSTSYKGAIVSAGYPFTSTDTDSTEPEVFPAYFGPATTEGPARSSVFTNDQSASTFLTTSSSTEPYPYAVLQRNFILVLKPGVVISLAGAATSSRIYLTGYLIDD